MKISDILAVLELIAPSFLQENYDNSGLVIGDKNFECSGVVLCLDATQEVVKEAIDKKCNLIIAHHPIIFSGLKKINGKNYVEQAAMLAIKNDIAIYACHTNLDNVLAGVNGKIADKLGLLDRSTLLPKEQALQKLTVFVPLTHLNQLEIALFNAGAGSLGNYSECSFVSEGVGSFKPNQYANPYSGEIGIRKTGKEMKLEVVFPVWLQQQVVKAMKMSHPYEELAYEISTLQNQYQQIGSGLIGVLSNPMSEFDFLTFVKEQFQLKVIKHSGFTSKIIQKVALCGGAGGFLIPVAKASGADVFLTADLKYHDFFDAEAKLLLADIGHFESEQYTIDLFYEVLQEKFPNFALLKTGINTNPVHYFLQS